MMDVLILQLIFEGRIEPVPFGEPVSERPWGSRRWQGNRVVISFTFCLTIRPSLTPKVNASLILSKIYLGIVIRQMKKGTGS
jgi:hypothetical protein